MKLEAFKSAPPASTPREAVPSSEPAEAEPQAPQGEQYVIDTAPNGTGIYYSWEPRRHYKLARHIGDTWQEVPSVTNVLGVLEKPALVWWGQGVGVEGTLTLAREYGLDLTKDQMVELLTEHKLTVNHVKDKAADRGVNVHGALEQWVGGKTISPEVFEEHERGYVEGLRDFTLAMDRAIAGNSAIAAELMVGSLQHQYAGRGDLWLTLSKPVEIVTKTYPKRKPRVEEIPAGRYLLDLKTSKGIYPTHFMQLEAYEAAAVECGYAPTDHRGVIHVTADGRYELALNKDWTIEDFLAVRKVYSVMNEREVLRVLREELDAKDVA